MVKTKKEDPVFIDLDLNRVQTDEEPITEAPKADVGIEPVKPEPQVEPTPSQTPPNPPAPVVDEVVGTPATVEEPVVETQPEWIPSVEGWETPVEWEEDPETVLKKILGLEDEWEVVLDTMPESEEKKALQSIIDQKQAIIEKLIKDKDEISFQKETGEIEKNEMKRLYGNLDEDDNLKQLVLYSNKAKTDDTFKDKKLNVLKEMLKIEWYDVDELNQLKIEKEKTALGWGESSKMTVDYKWWDGKDWFIKL